MITDALTRFSNQQPITTGTVTSTNAYDLGIARDVGRGRGLRIYVSADVAFVGGNGVQVNIIQSSNSDLSNATVIGVGASVADQNLTPGAVLMDSVLPKTSARYVGLQYISFGTHTAGTVSANMVLDTDSLTNFAANTGF